MIKRSNFYHKLLSGFTAFLLILQSFAPTLVFAQVVTAPAPLEESLAPASEPSPSPATKGEVSPTPMPEVTPTATPQPSEILVEPSPTPNPSPEPSESPIPSATLEPQVSPQPQESSEPIAAPEDQTDVISQTQDNANQANAPPSDVNPTDTVEPSVSPSPSATPTIETIESQGQIAGQLTTYILENTSASSAEEVLDIDPVNVVESASLSTDKADYAPTDTAVIKGLDFPKVANLKLIITAENYRYETQVKTDKNGEFVYFYQLDGTYRPLYIVEAYDLSGALLATVSFTDSPPSGGSFNYTLQGLIFAADPNNESSWSKGNLCQSGGGCYTEGEDIPGRLTITGLTQGVTYSVVLQQDYDDGAGHLGYISFNNTSTVRADSGVTNTTITFLNDVPCGGSVICRNYELKFIATSTTAILYWDSVLGLDAAEWNGASLHFRLESGIGGENVGNKEGPVQVSQILFLPSVTLTKVVDSGSATPDQWCFNISPNINGISQACIPQGQNSVTFDNIASGSYTITETGLSNYIFASGSGPNCIFSGSEATATVAPGDPATNASCTFHNAISQGTIIVEKQTNPDGAIGSFTFSGDVSGTISDNGQIVVSNILPGIYTSTETASTDWNLTNISCNDSNSSGNLNTNTATFQLDPGETVKCTFTNTQKGKIIVEKQTNPDGSVQSFEFDSSYGDNFFLTDGQSNDSGILTPGIYSVSELVPSGWTLTSALCNDGSSPSNITLSAGETVTCTFANTQLGTIIVEKQTNPDGDLQSFTFNGDAAGSISDNGQIVVDHLLPGTYTSTETVSGYWDLTGISCNDTNSSGNLGNKTATFNVSAGEVVKCTFTNTKKGHLIVQKTTLPGGDPTLFNINLTGSGSITGASEGAISDSTDKDYEVTAGAYSVLETVPSGWDKTADTCQGVVVSAGQTVICTITNTKQGSITILKDADPDAAQDFQFTGSFGDFQLDDDSNPVLQNSKTFTNVEPGVYSVSEVTVAGWDLTNTSCSDGSSVDSIQLDPGESIICTFINTKKGHLIVHKVTSPKDTTTEFIISASGSGSVSDPATRTIVGGDSADFEVTPGAYSVSEAVSPGWDESSNTCQDVLVSAGQTVECTITNTQLGTIIVEKQTNPDGDQTGFGFNGDATGVISDNGQILVFDLLPGTYTSVEVVPPGWDLTDISCNDNDSLGDVSSTTATFNLQAGERVKCIFTNTKRGHLIVEKTTLPGGDLTLFSIQVSGSGTISSLGSGIITDALDQMYEVTPGTYSITETMPQGWDKTQDTCQNVVVSAGQIVTCTITNTKRGEIIVEKQSLPDSSQQSFEFSPSYSSNFYLSDGQTNSSGLLVPGLHSVAEFTTDGWDLTNAACSDGSNPDSIILDPGERVICTFENTQRGTISGAKYEVNADGSIVSVLSGWVISLFDGNDSLVSQTSTDIPGNFSFTNIVNGIYSLAEDLLSGWTQIFAPQQIAINPGEASTDNNFGNFQNGTISGMKFNDLNGNGQKDQGEAGLQNWIIFIDLNGDGSWDDGELSRITDLNGDYAFSDLGPSFYTVCEVEQPGWFRTKPGSSNCELVTLTNSGQTIALDFGNQGRGTIRVNKNVDSNGDGVIDIVGATDWTWDVNSTGNFVTGSTQQVAAGTYTISEDQKANYHIVSLVCGQTNFRALESQQITVVPGENVVCTFTNAQDTGTITILKNVDTNGDGDVLDQVDVVGATDWTYDLQNGEQNIPTGQSRILPTGIYTISEDLKIGFELVEWSCLNGQTGTTNEIVVNISKDSEAVCILTNKQLPAQLILEKTNNRLGVDVTAGADVLYTLTVTLSGSGLDNVSLIDLLPSGFEYRSGSWTVVSSVRGDLKGLGITPEPVYSSPGNWQLGDMVSGEVVTISLLADIDGGVDPGLYKDLSWAKGAGVSSNEVLANENSGIFVGTEVNVVGRPQGVSYDVENVEKVEKKEIAEVLGVSTQQLPQTGADGRWIILALSLLVLGLISLGAGMVVRRRYE